MSNNNGEEEEDSIDGDILVSILSKLSLLDLVSACQVSKSWYRAVFFSLRLHKTKPWLFFYRQRRSPPYTMATTSMAYDPNSDQWIQIKSPVQHLSSVRSSTSTFLYALSPSRFSFSIDAFHLTWQHVAPPSVSRAHPIVAVVGRKLIVAGGVCDFEDDRLAVEMLNIESGGGVWERCESMPEIFWGTASSVWLSVAASSEKMYVTEERTGDACCFDPETRSWTELFDFSPGDCNLYSRAIGFAGNRLIMAGISGDVDNPAEIEMWEVVVSDKSPKKPSFESIGSMPKACLDKLNSGSGWPLISIAFNAVGDMVYIHDVAETGEIVAAEMDGGRLCKWRTLHNANATWDRNNAGERLIVACSNVGFCDLKRAFRNDLSFSVV